MSSSGEEKFNEYFKGNQTVDVFAKGFGGKDVDVYFDTRRRSKKTSIKDGTPITIYPNETYQSRYRASFNGDDWGYLSDINVGKPPRAKKVGDPAPNPELSRITASNFIDLGDDTEFIFEDKEVQCKQFECPETLINSIRHGMSQVRAVSKPVENTFSSFFEDPELKKFKWDSDVTDVEKRKFGVYFGELFIGLYALTNQLSHINRVPWSSSPARWIIPKYPSFSGIDSFLEMQDGKIIPISSKYGIGTPASFFTNLLSKGMKYFDRLPKSVFKDIAETAFRLGYTAEDINTRRAARPIIYEFGIRNILKMPIDTVKNTLAIYEALKFNKYTDERKLVITTISNHKNIEPRVKQALGNSTTAFLCREFARALNNDAISMKIMTDILTETNFWQCNLNKKYWEKRGVAQFDMFNSGVASLVLTGNKSPIEKLGAPNGTISYFLKG